MDSSIDKKEKTTKKDDDTSAASNSKKLAVAQLATAAGLVKETTTTSATAATSTKTGTSNTTAIIDPKDVALLAAPSIEDEFDDVNNSTEQPLVSPGAVHVRGRGANNAQTNSLMTAPHQQDGAAANDIDDDNATLSLLPQNHQLASFIAVASPVSEEDIRRQYSAEARDNNNNDISLLGEPVHAESLDDDDDDENPRLTKHQQRIITVGIVVAIIVLAAVLVSVLVVELRPSSSSSAKNNNPEHLPSPSQTCAMMTEFLRSNNTNLTALLLNQTVSNATLRNSVTTYYEDDGNGMPRTYDIFANSALRTSSANSLCTWLLGGTYVEENFTVQCNKNNNSVNSRSLNNSNWLNLYHFLHNFVCVGAGCNTSEVETYLEAQIASQTRALESNHGQANCQILYATYQYQNVSTSATPQQQQQQQVLYYLPSIWGAQCALEYDNITNNINSFTASHDTFISPSCRRNGTTNDAVCTVDFTYDATQISGPFCTQIGGKSLPYNFTFRCTSQSGSTYVVEHLNQPICTGVNCSSSQVYLYTADLLRSSLATQGYRNCHLLSSPLTYQNVSKQQQQQYHLLNNNTFLTSGVGGECAAATATSSSDSNLAAYYAVMNAELSATANSRCQANTTDFSNIAFQVQTYYCGSGYYYVEEDFTIVCDSFNPNNDGTCIYSYANVFFCLGETCNSSEVESYLEWPLVSQTQALENGGQVQNCQVRYGSYTNFDDNQISYLPSIWGDKCVAENKLVSSNTGLNNDNSDNSTIKWTCQQRGSQASCTSDHIGYNTQIEAACLTIGGKYFEVDFAFTCSYQVGSITTFALEYLRYPQCTGMSCNVNQSSAESVETIKVDFSDKYELQDCQFIYENASVQHQNESGFGECTLGTNNLSTNVQRKPPLSCQNNGNKRNCIYDYGSDADRANALCQDSGGQYAEFNFTIGNCIKGDGYYNYVRYFFCLGLSCNTSQINSYFNGEAFLEALRSNCKDLLHVSYLSDKNNSS